MTLPTFCWATRSKLRWRIPRYTTNISETATTYSCRMIGGFAGNLTLNFGLRYEFISPFHEAHNELANLITQVRRERQLS